METVEEMWARIDARYKSKCDEIVNAKVECENDAYRFIELLGNMANIYVESFIDEEKQWEDVFANQTFTDTFAHNDLFGRYNEIAKKSIIEKLAICDSLIGRKVVAMMFYRLRQEREYKKPHVHYMSGDEEARECNRQFSSMMGDNDAWGNID